MVNISADSLLQMEFSRRSARLGEKPAAGFAAEMQKAAPAPAAEAKTADTPAPHNAAQDAAHFLFLGAVLAADPRLSAQETDARVEAFLTSDAATRATAMADKLRTARKTIMS